MQIATHLGSFDGEGLTAARHRLSVSTSRDTAALFAIAAFCLAAALIIAAIANPVLPA